WAEAVVSVPLVRADRVARDVAGHVLELEVQSPSCVSGRIRDGEVIVRPGLEADSGIERVAGCERRRGWQRHECHPEANRQQKPATTKATCTHPLPPPTKLLCEVRILARVRLARRVPRRCATRDSRVFWPMGPGNPSTNGYR